MNVSSLCLRIIRTGFALLFITIPLVLTPWNYELFEYNKMMLTYAITAIIIGSWLVKMIADRKIHIRKTPLDIPLLLFFLSQGIATLFSMDPHVSWFGYYSRFNGGLLSTITYILLYYAFTTNIPEKPASQKNHADMTGEDYSGKSLPRFLGRFLKAALVTGGIVSLYGVLEHFGIDKNLWVQDVQSRIFSTLGQPNWLAAYVVVLIPLSMAFAAHAFPFKKNGHKQKITWIAFHFFPFLVWSFLSVLFFLTLLYTRSRSGLLAFFIMDILFWTVLLVWNGKKHGWKKFGAVKNNPVFRPFLLLNTAFCIIVVINGTYVEHVDRFLTFKGWYAHIQNKISTTQTTDEEATPAATTSNQEEVVATGPLLETGGTESGTIRKYVWEGAVNAWKSSPKTMLIGTGTETFAFAFYQYKPLGHNLTSEWDFLYNKAHNEYLNFLATTGIFGLGSYLFLIASFMTWFIRFLIRKAKEGEENIGFADVVILALSFGWTSILVTNFFGFSVVIIQLFFFLIPAVAFSLYWKNSQEYSYCFMPRPIASKVQTMGKTTARIISASIGIITFFVILLLVRMWIGDKTFALGYRLNKSGQIPSAYSYVTEAIQYNPDEPLYHDERSTILSLLALAAFQNNQATLASELADMAILENDTALSISPNNVNFWKSRTKLFYTISSIRETYINDAITAVQMALTYSPYDPKIMYNLAILWGYAGAEDKSIEALEETIRLKPNYRDAYNALYVFYKETGQEEKATNIIRQYLETVDGKDSEFKTFLET